MLFTTLGNPLRTGWHLLQQFCKPAPPAHSSPFLIKWLHQQPPTAHIIITIDSDSGELMSLEAVPRNQRPAALSAGLTDSPHTAWQARGKHYLHRRNFEPAQILDQRQDALLMLEEITAARLAALNEMMLIDQEMLRELDRLGAHFEVENVNPGQ